MCLLCMSKTQRPIFKKENQTLKDITCRKKSIIVADGVCVFAMSGAEEKILEDFREVYSPSAMDFHLQAMVQSAGKLVLIDKLLPKMKAGGHKVLIFSQMVRCLDILEDYLIQRRYQWQMKNSKS